MINIVIYNVYIEICDKQILALRCAVLGRVGVPSALPIGSGSRVLLQHHQANFLSERPRIAGLGLLESVSKALVFAWDHSSRSEEG